jgi:hypothetical protein
MPGDTALVDRLEESYRATFSRPLVFPTYEDYGSIVIARIHDAIYRYDPDYLFPHDAAVFLLADVLTNARKSKADVILKMHGLLAAGNCDDAFAKQGILVFDAFFEDAVRYKFSAFMAQNMDFADPMPENSLRQDFLHYILE